MMTGFSAKFGSDSHNWLATSHKVAPGLNVPSNLLPFSKLRAIVISDSSLAFVAGVSSSCALLGKPENNIVVVVSSTLLWCFMSYSSTL